MATLTVIIPFYDETAYLRSALNSVLSQRIDGLQVIVVNDNPDRFGAADLAALGAGDGSVELIQHKCNLGLSAARNSGLEQARGRYVGFLDADDYYTLSGLAGQLDMAYETQADIIHAPTYFTRIGSPETRILQRDAAFFMTRKTAGGLLRAEQAQFITSSWSSLYSRDFLFENDLWFDTEQTRFEDRLFVLHSVTRARRLAFTGTPSRVWRGRAGSISVTATTPDTHRLQIQLLEKCMAHMRAEGTAGRLPPRFEKRELFNTVSRLIWDLDVIDAIAERRDPAYEDLARRIPALLGADSFGHAIFDDKILAPVSRVGMKTRKGRIARADFFAIHRALRGGDFAAAQRLIQGCAQAPERPKPRPGRQARRLVLHLGMHKTGTTYIQHHLSRHRAQLGLAGVLVPVTGFDDPDQPLRPGATPGHQGLVAALRRDDPAPFAELRREIRRAGADTVVLSCENMLFPTLPERDGLIAALAGRLGRYDRIELVALVRRPDTYAEAFYRERVAGGARIGARGIDAFMVDHGAALSDLPALFAPFEERFATKVRLADFDALRGDGLWPGFARLAGLPEDLPALEVPLYPTPDRDSILILQLLNTLVPDAGLRAQILQGWFTLHPRPAHDASLLAPAARAGLLDLWQAQSASFAAARGYAPDLDAARAALRADPWAPPESVPADKLLDLLDAATQAAEPLFSAAPARPKPGRTPGEMSLTIRLRPWAADLLRRVTRRGA